MMKMRMIERKADGGADKYTILWLIKFTNLSFYESLIGRIYIKS